MLIDIDIALQDMVMITVSKLSKGSNSQVIIGQHHTTHTLWHTYTLVVPGLPGTVHLHHTS